MTKVVPPPPKARSCRPKEPQYARPLPISSYPDVGNPGSMGNYWQRIQEWEWNQQYGYHNDQEFSDDPHDSTDYDD